MAVCGREGRTATYVVLVRGRLVSLVKSVCGYLEGKEV